jgi:beta-lactamase class A
MQEMTEKLNQLCDEQPFSTTWWVKDLRSGEIAHRDGDKVVPSASTRKISIMLATLNQVNEGKRSLDEPFIIEEQYQKNANGAFQYLKPGLHITLYDAIVMMIIVSDNTCTGMIADRVGIDNINAYCKKVGMKGTTHRFTVPPTHATELNHPIEASNSTTAADSGHVLDLLITGTKDESAASQLGLTPELCQLGVDIMSWQILTSKLPAQLPPEASVAHKTGTGRRMANDAGIIFENGEPRFVMSVYVDGAPPQQKRMSPGSAARRGMQSLLHQHQPGRPEAEPNVAAD